MKNPPSLYTVIKTEWYVNILMRRGRWVNVAPSSSSLKAATSDQHDQDQHQHDQDQHKHDQDQDQHHDQDQHDQHDQDQDQISMIRIMIRSAWSGSWSGSWSDQHDQDHDQISMISISISMIRIGISSICLPANCYWGMCTAPPCFPRITSYPEISGFMSWKTA